MKKVNYEVSFSEKKRIISLHENATKNLYLKEQTKVVTGYDTEKKQSSFPKINLGDNFEYGKYQSENAKQKILDLKPKIEEFIKNSDFSKFLINISAGESQVKNPKGFETPGSLALARANEIKKYFQEVFPDLIKKGVLIINSPQKVTDVKIGETPYGGKDSGDRDNVEKVKKYKEEQFVDFDITGEGSKEVKVEKSKYLCNTKPQESQGGYLNADVNYTQVVPWELGKGEGEIYLWLDTITMPDILYFEYNGETFGHSLFRGSGEDAYRIYIGTALRAKFGLDSLPAHMNGNKIVGIQRTDSRIIDSLDEMGEWGLEKSFKNTFGPESSLSNPRWMEFFKEFDKTKNKRKLIKNLGNEFPWGYLNSNIGMGTQTNIGPIKKIDGVDVIKVINVAPIGSTKWQCGLQCKTKS